MANVADQNKRASRKVSGEGGDVRRRDVLKL